MAGARIQLKRGTAAEWTAANTVLYAGEIGIETDTGKIKIGNGSTAWNSLPHFSAANIHEFAETVADTVGAMVTSNTENGITVTYDDSDNTLDFDVADFTITLSGDLTGSATITNLGDATLTATIAANSVALGTDTTGSYVASLVAGTGVTLSNNSGESATPTVAIGQAVGTTDNVQFNDVTVAGNLTVNGTTTTLNTENLLVEDNIIVLNSNVTGSPSTNAGIEVERGDSTNVVLRWNESTDKWEITQDGSSYDQIVGRATTDTLTNKTYDTAGTGNVFRINGNQISSYVGSGANVVLSSNPTITNLFANGFTVEGASIVFEGATANDFETTLTVTDPTADRTVTLQDASGTVALLGTIALGTDTTGNYVSDVAAGTGISVTHTPGEGSTPTVSLSAALDALSDVVITAPEEFQGLSYNGTTWVNSHIPLVSYVRNAEATTITTGTVVYLFGATGDHATVKRADNDADSTSSKTIGVVGADIAAGQNGPVVTRGYVDGIDLSTGYNPGDVLWLADDGAFTNVKPVSPNHLVFVGVVVRATNNGIIYVATQNGYELDELHDVYISSPASGQFLKYDGTIWVNDAIDLTTDTVGSYVASLVAGTGVTLSNNSGEGATPTIAIGQAVGTGDSPTFAGLTLNGSVTFEGATANDFETTLAVADPTADRTITLPDESGTVAIKGTIALATDTTGNFVASLVAGTGITLSNNSGENATPTVAVDTSTIATRAYVDSAAAGINWHEAVDLATAAVLPNSPSYSNGTSGVGATLTGTTNGRLVVDGANASNGDRILVQTQADAKQNGIYVVTDQGSISTVYVLTRASDADNNIAGQVKAGDAVFVLLGATHANQGFILTSQGTGTGGAIVIGTDDIVFTQFTGTATLVAGGGMTKTGNTIDVVTANSGRIVVNADSIDLGTVSQTDTSGSATTTFVSNIAVDSYGRVTGKETSSVSFSSVITKATLTAKGDLISASGSATPSVLAVGTNGYVLKANSAQTTGLEWGTLAIDDLSDVTITSATSGQFLKWNGSAWINDAIDLATDTVGNYVNDITAGTGVTVTHTPGEGSSPTIAIGQQIGTADSPTFAGLTLNGNIVFEGATADANETTFAITDPTADRTITFPDASGTVAILGTIALGTDTTGNYVATISGTTDQVSVSGSGSENAAITLSLPQNIATTSSPTFAGVTADNIQVGITGANEIDTASGNLTIDSAGGTTTIDDNLVVSGDLTVNGTTVTVNSTTVTVDDKNIELGSTASPDDTTANGGGITLKGATDKTFNWSSSTEAWTSSEHMNLASGKAYYVNGTQVLSGTALGAGVTSSSLTTFGSSPTVFSPLLTLSNVSTTDNGRFWLDTSSYKLNVGDGTTSREFASSTIVTNAQTASYTLVLADKDKMVEVNVGSANTLTVPPNSSVAYPVGTQIRVLQTGAGQTTLTPGVGVTINGTPGLKLRAQWSSATLIKRATDTWVAVGDLSA